MSKYVIDPERHPIASTAVFVTTTKKPGQFLIADRYKKLPKGKKFQACIPGGKVDWMETVEEAAIREVLEETGLKVKLTKFIGFADERWTDIDAHYTCLYFVARVVGSLEVTQSEEEKVKMGNFRWVTPKECPTLFGMATPMLLKNLKHIVKK